MTNQFPNLRDGVQEQAGSAPESFMDDSSGHESVEETTLKDSNGHGKEEREVIAKREGKIVAIWRIAVLVVLLASAIAVSVGMYRYGTSQEEDKFQDKFIAEANKVHEQ